MITGNFRRQIKVEVLQVAKLASIAVDSTYNEFSILALEDATSQSPLYKKGLFSKTDKYISQVFELHGHSPRFMSNL